MYDSFEKVNNAYDSLQDDLSRNVFWARMQYDFHPDQDSINRLAQLYDELALRQRAQSQKWDKEMKRLKKRLDEVADSVYIYGAGYSGTTVGAGLQKAGYEICGYIDQNAGYFEHGAQGLPVLTPERFLERKENVFVINGVSHKRNGYERVERWLAENGFSKDRIWNFYQDLYMQDLRSPAYIQFLDHFHDGTAFVDVGCYNGENSIYFAKACAGRYSKILAFEPDGANYRRCVEYMKDIGNAEVYRLALADRPGTLNLNETSDQNGFLSLNDSGAYHTYNSVFHNANNKQTEVKVDALDHIVGEAPVGYIKLEAMGAEYAVLHGARRCIERDRPIIAVLIHHRPYDMVSIMSYLKEIVPEYRFWLRQYYWAPARGLLFAVAG